MFALTRLVYFPFILRQVSLSLGKPTPYYFKPAGIDKLCALNFHKVKRSYSSVITIVENNTVEEAKEQETEEIAYKVNLATIKPKLKLIYTCKICDTRNTKYFSKLAYEKGIVIVICDCCDSKHLIADNLQWFKDNGTNVEKMLSEKGELVKRGKVIFTEEGDEINIVQNNTIVS